MNQHARNNSEVRAEHVAKAKCQTLKLGLDVHADSIVVVRILDHSAPQPAQKFSPSQFLRWAQSQRSLAESVHSCYEAGPFGYGLHRQLVELGIQNVVVQPVCLDERHKGVNHDKSDARELAMRLDRYVAGNTHAVAIVRVPSVEQEQRRAQSRQREQLRRQLQRVASQGRSLLLSQGYRERKNWWEKGRWERLHRHLAPWLVERLEVFRRVLETLEKELTALTQALEAAARPARPKGLGAMTCEIVEREIGDWNRFNNRRQVSSYTGLCGGLSSSGNTTYHLSITKHGNARVRTALIELAWRLVRWQPSCKLVKKWWRILGNSRATKGSKKKAIVAVARQAAVDLWRWHTGRVSPEELGWVMIGS
jgi:transposase